MGQTSGGVGPIRLDHGGGKTLIGDRPFRDLGALTMKPWLSWKRRAEQANGAALMHLVVLERPWFHDV